ncbi:hypothetical protein NDU88_004073 [Pleurodeles waltl]|uniref:Uncharacterized protein n=1 Tax=Pleurodeles waltl TaxID=8319 RepID=A0AAV7WQU6_PLEWA|nr:hypothetical protein NDU88_004073 [Pleurodeles waltl]
MQDGGHKLRELWCRRGERGSQLPRPTLFGAPCRPERCADVLPPCSPKTLKTVLRTLADAKSDSIGLADGVEEASASSAPPLKQDSARRITSRNTAWRSLAGVVVLAVQKH